MTKSFLFILCLLPGISACSQQLPVDPNQDSSHLQSLVDVDEGLVLRLSQVSSQRELYSFEVCRADEDPTDEAGTCVDAFQAASGSTFTLTLQEVMDLPLNKAEHSELSAINGSWKNYRSALAGHAIGTAAAGGIAAAGGTLAVKADRVFPSYAVRNAQENFALEQSRQMQPGYFDHYRTTVENTRELIRKTKRELTQLGLSTEELPSHTLTRKELKFQSHVLTDYFVDFFKRRANFNNAAGAVDSLLIRPALHDHIDYTKIVQDFFDMGHNARDIIQPQYWERFVKFHSIESALTGEVTSSLDEAFIKNTSGTLNRMQEFVFHRGVPPSVIQRIRLLKRNTKLLEEVLLPPAQKLNSLRVAKETALLEQVPRIKFIRSLVIITTAAAALALLVSTKNAMHAAGQSFKEKGGFERQEQLQIIADYGTTLAETDPTTEQNVDSVVDILPHLGAYLRSLSSAEDPPHSYCYPGAEGTADSQCFELPMLSS